MNDSIKVFAPATVANVACGFDIFGFAVDNPGDELVLRKTDLKGVKINKIEGDEGRLPLDASKNTAGIAIIKFLEAIGAESQGFEMDLKKLMPLGSGLGSSAASSVAGVFAANELLGRLWHKKTYYLLRWKVSLLLVVRLMPTMLVQA
jgi:homoserine kinase